MNNIDINGGILIMSKSEKAKELLKELGFEYYCTFEKMKPIYHKL